MPLRRNFQMCHAVTNLGAFGVVEPVHRTDEIPRDPPDAFKFHSIPHLAVNDGQVVEFMQGGCVHTSSTVAMPH